MSRRTLAFVCFFGALLFGAVVGCGLPLAGLTPTATPTATATPTPTSTPTPTPTPAPQERLELGEWALFVGDWDRAQREFEAAGATAADEQARGEARLGVGKTHLRAGRYDEAETVLTEYIEGFPDHPLAWEGFFLRGIVRRESGKLEAAVADFERYLELRPGRIDGYVHENVGDILLEMDRPLEAVEHYQAALAAEKLGGDLRLQIRVGQAYAQAGQYEQALAQYDAVFQAAGDPATKATANLLAGRALESMGAPQAAYDRYLQSVNEFPRANDSYLGLITLVEAGVPVDEFQRGLVDFYAGAYQPALQAFNRADAAGSVSAQLYYYRGLTLRALGDPVSAVSDFDVVISSYPDSTLWAEAWFEKAVTQWAYLERHPDAVETYLDFSQAASDHPRAAEALLAAGRTAERSEELAQAGDIWLDLVDRYPESALAHEAAFAAGIVRYREARIDAARGAFETAERLAPGVTGRTAALLWIGKTHAAQGRDEMARQSWIDAQQMDPTGYYAERAGDLAEGQAPFESTGPVNFEVDMEADRAEAEVWLRENFAVDGPEPLTSLDEALRDDPRRIRGDEFWRLGLYGHARNEFEALRSAVEGDAEATYRLMHHLLDLGLYRPAIFAARHVLDLAGYDDAGTLLGPVYFNRIRFGIYYEDLILPAASENGFGSLFLLSVVRQESLFEGFATSVAAARGLMQVIPSTGQEIATELGWPPNYTQDDLYRPVISVRFGTHYLAEQRELFEGDLVAALTAYNAGPGNALAWKQLAPDDSDLYLEVVRFEEPRLYVRRIYEIYAIYQKLYLGE